MNTTYDTDDNDDYLYALADIGAANPPGMAVRVLQAMELLPDMALDDRDAVGEENTDADAFAAVTLLKSSVVLWMA